MKIAICGTHGTGKTTLAQALSRKLNLPLIREVAREIASEGFPVLSRFSTPTLRTQFAIFGRQLYEEQRYSHFVADRSILDNLAYMRLIVSKDFDQIDMWCHLVRFARMYAKRTYDVLVYVPIEFRVPSDGFRHTDSKTREKVDAILRKLLLGLSFVVVKGTTEERVEEVLKYAADRQRTC